VGVKIRDQANKYAKFGQFMSGKSLKYCHLMPHCKAKMHQIRFLAAVRLSLCSFLCLCLRWRLEFDTQVIQIRQRPYRRRNRAVTGAAISVFSCMPYVLSPFRASSVGFDLWCN